MPTVVVYVRAEVEVSETRKRFLAEGMESEYEMLSEEMRVKMRAKSAKIIDCAEALPRV